MTDHQALISGLRSMDYAATNEAADAIEALLARAEKAEAERDAALARVAALTEQNMDLRVQLQIEQGEHVAAHKRNLALTEALRTEHDNYSGHDQPERWRQMCAVCALLAGAEPPTPADEPCPNPACDGKANPRGGFCSQQCGTVTRRCARCGTVGGGGTITVDVVQPGEVTWRSVTPTEVPCPECGDKTPA